MVFDDPHAINWRPGSSTRNCRAASRALRPEISQYFLSLLSISSSVKLDHEYFET